MRIAILAAFLALVGGLQASAGPSDGVLLVYDTTGKPFSLENEIDPLELLLSRFSGVIERRASRDLKPADLESASRIVVAGIAGFPEMPPECLEYLRKTSKPVLGVGAAAGLACDGTPDRKVKPQALEAGQILYLGSERPGRVDPYFAFEVDKSRVLARVLQPGRDEKPLCWASGSRYGFASLPSAPPLSMVFSDVLIDFFGAGEMSAPGLLFIVRDFNPSSQPGTLRRLADYFAHLGIPFAVTAQMRDLPEGTTPMPREEFLGALAYAQLRGGRIFLRGGDRLADAPKFESEGIVVCGLDDPDRPDPSALQIGAPALKRTPDGAATPFFIHAPMGLPEGGWLWPANVKGGLDGILLEDIRRQVRDIASFRGSVAGVVLPAWLPFQSLRDLVDAARSSAVPAIDPVTAVPENHALRHP